LEDGMGFKKIDKKFSFADVALESSKKNNRSIQKMYHLNKLMRPLHNPSQKVQNEPSFMR